MSQQRIELCKLIQGLRDELSRAWWEGQRDAIGFEAGPTEIELAVQTELNAEAKGGVKFWVVDAGTSAGIATSNTQRITLTLTPRDRRDPTRPLMIAGEEVPGED